MTARLPPTVGVFEPVFNGGIPYVGVDDVEGARKAVELLIAEGHRKIAFIGENRSRLAYSRRRLGCEAGLDAAGIPAASRMVIEGDGSIESGRLAVDQLFLRDTLPTAFMCVNDQTAIGVMLGLSARGYQVPRDFSVTGWRRHTSSGIVRNRRCRGLASAAVRTQGRRAQMRAGHKV